MNNSIYPQFFPKLRGALLSLGLIGGLAFSPLATAKTQEKNLAPNATSTSTSQESASASTAANDSSAAEAKDEFSGGFKGVGRGFSKGTKVTGRAFKKAGVTVGQTFKKVGSTIKNWFTGDSSSPAVEERSLNESATQYVPEGDLDSVGDEAKPSVKKPAKQSAKSTGPGDLALN